MPQFNYTLTGTIEVPEGSRLMTSRTAIVLPDGSFLKLWESWELNPEPDVYRDLSFDECGDLGIFYDGDVAVFTPVGEKRKK